MRHFFSWIVVIICATCAPVLIVLSFVLGATSPGGIRIGLAQFLIPVVLSWAAVFPRSAGEWRDLKTGHPIAQRFFGGRPAGFFGDYRRKLTPLGRLLLFGTLILFLLSLYRGSVHAELFIIGFLFVVALSSWIIRLEIKGDRTAAILRQIATALIYRPFRHGS